MFTVMTLCAIGSVSALFMNFVALSAQDPVEYTWITANADGKQSIACDAVVLEQPIIRPDAITAFARDAILAINDYTYLSWGVVLPEALDAYFTPAAGRVYLRDFQGSRLLKTVNRNYYRSSAISTFPSVLVNETSFGDRREWTVQVPVTVYYSTGTLLTNSDDGTSRGGARHRRTVHRIYTVRLVEQKPTHANYRGVAVVDVNAASVRGVQEFLKANARLSSEGGERL